MDYRKDELLADLKYNLKQTDRIENDVHISG